MFEKYFPYESYRPGQREMLQRVYDVAKSGQILMLNAPTGIGKSSVVVPLLALAREKGYKVLIGVRTISQLKIFCEELDRIRNTKFPDLKFTSFVGKSTICPKNLSGNDPYVFCDIMKRFTLNHMSGSMITSTYCEYYCNSYNYVNGELYPTEELNACSDYCCSHPVMNSESVKSAAVYDQTVVCPYEMLCNSARNSDVIIVNYNHLIDKDIRNSFFYNLNIDPLKCYVLLDEAHNIGDAIQDIESYSITSKQLNDCIAEINYYKSITNRNLYSVADLVAYVQNVISQCESSKQTEGILDAVKFKNGMFTFDSSLDDLSDLVEYLRENPVSNFEYKECCCEKLYKFLNRVSNASHNPDYLLVYSKNTYGVVLECKNIDPSQALLDFVKLFASVCMISGTMSPINMYSKYYFSDKIVVNTTEIGNIFPKENRKIYICNDITSMYSKRDDPRNVRAIVEYINKFVEQVNGSVAIYFPSYQIMNSFVDILKPSVRNNRLHGKQMFVEPKTSVDAAALLQKFFELPDKNDNGVMFAISGGKWSEGLDFRGDILSGAMVIGLPLAQFTLIRKAINEHFRLKFGKDGEFIAYTLPAVNRACQALGRVIRTETDKGVLVLGDYRYSFGDVNFGLPTWIRKEAIKTTANAVDFKF